MQKIPKNSLQITDSISVVIMLFNECKTFEDVFNEINSELNNGHFKTYEIVIVDDGSTDGSEIIADVLENKYSHVRVIHHDMNKGLGEVYRTGFGNAKNDLIIFFSADGQFPSTNINKFVPLINDFDMILGYLPDRKCSIIAKLLSGVERALLKIAFGKIPKFQGQFILRRKLFEEMELKSDGRAWMVVMELIIRASRGGYKIASIPHEIRPRISGKSKVNNIPVILSYLKQIAILNRFLKKS